MTANLTTFVGNGPKQAPFETNNKFLLKELYRAETEQLTYENLTNTLNTSSNGTYLSADDTLHQIRELAHRKANEVINRKLSILNQEIRQLKRKVFPKNRPGSPQPHKEDYYYVYELPVFKKPTNDQERVEVNKQVREHLEKILQKIEAVIDSPASPSTFTETDNEEQPASTPAATE